MPGGFKISSDSSNYVSDGVVIEDANGNQFVWIPVTSSSQYVRNVNYENKSISSVACDTTGYLPSGISNEKQAVLNAGGFYIGRFETGGTWTELLCKKGIGARTGISQSDAKENAKIYINNNYAKSALISGIQWDVTMAFVNRKKRWSRSHI